MRFGRKAKPRRSPKARAPKNAPLTYYRSGSGEASPSPFEKRPAKAGRVRAIFIRFLTFLLLALLLFGIGWGTLINPNPTISLNSEAYHPVLDYKTAAAEQLHSLKNRNKLTIDSSQIASSLKKQFPEINAVYLQMPLFGKNPKLHIVVSPPKLLLASEGKTYVVDEKGVAVGESNQGQGSKDLVNVQDQSGLKAAIGKQILTSEAVAFINLLSEQCRLSKIEIKSLSLPATAPELNLRTNDSAYFVRFLLPGEPLQQIGQFLTAREQFEKGTPKPGEYLDVRVPGKIFYK